MDLMDKKAIWWTTRRPSEIEFGIGCRGELLRHLELVSEIGFGLSWMPMDGLRLVDDKMVIWK